MDKIEVAIIGECHFHNQLFMEYIENKLKLRCVCKNGCHHSSSVDSSLLETKILLCDCHGLTPVDIQEKFRGCLSKELENSKVVFFNLQPGDDFESVALAQGAKGVFYTSDPLDKFEKGLQAVMNDELWFSRANISKFLNKSQQLSRNRADADPSSLLTSREKQILSMMVTGCNNRNISEALCISPHTVKTHLNNIFSKIKVSDRVQAVLWAIKYL